MSEPTAPAARTVVLVGLAVAAVVGVVWVIGALVGGDDGGDDVTGQLHCLDGQHRPGVSGQGPSVVHLGVIVAGPGGPYEMTVQLPDGVQFTSIPATAPVGPIVVPISTDSPAVEVVAIQIVEPDAGGEGATTDVTEQVLGPEPWVITLSETEGALREGVGPCPAPEGGRVHPGFVFAPPQPPFAGDDTPAPDNTKVLVDQFMTDFAVAHAAADIEGLVATLHPVVAEGYGDEICRAHVATTAGALPALQIDAVAPAPGYRFQRPGGDDPLTGAVVVDAQAALADGGTGRWRFNLVVEDGDVYWLSWCGN